MREKERKASLLSWIMLRHRVRGVARNPEMLMSNPDQFKRDVAKLDKLMRTQLRTLGWLG